MIKSRTEVDEVQVKKVNDEADDWCAVCRVCHEEVCGTLHKLKDHVKSHGK